MFIKNALQFAAKLYCERKPLHINLLKQNFANAFASSEYDFDKLHECILTVYLNAENIFVQNNKEITRNDNDGDNDDNIDDDDDEDGFLRFLFNFQVNSNDGQIDSSVFTSAVEYLASQKNNSSNCYNQISVDISKMKKKN